MRLMGIMGLMGLIGCSSEDADLTVEEGIPVELVSYMTEYQEGTGDTRATEITRAWYPSGFEQYMGTDLTIGVCFTKNNETPLTGYFYHSGGKWRTLLELQNAGNYYLYGYTPHVSGMSCDISSSTTPNDNSAYSNGAVMTIRKMPVASSSDVCVVVGAKNAKANPPAENFQVAQGDFMYEAAPITKDPGGESSTGNYVYLLFDHLYAALRISMRVDGTYNDLRTIKLKELKLRTKQGETNVPRTTDITVQLAKTTDGSSPIMKDGSGNSLITFDTTGNEEYGDNSIFSSSTGVQLSTSWSEYMQGYFMPQDVTTLILTSVYDVYDTKGNLTRENSKAENTIVLADLISEQTYALRGHRYTINMLIQPTYLYVLSEPDLDNPTLNVEH